MLEYPIEIDVAGDYHDIGVFVALLEESPRSLVMKSVEIKSDEGDPGSQTARVELGVASWED
jgi:Tfp pilus assembly protein PilO